MLANANIDVTIYPGSSTTLNGSATGGTPPYSYSWSPTTGLDNPTIVHPIASPSITTTYTLTVIDSNNWTAQDEVIITVSTATTLFIQPTTASLTADSSVTFTCVARDNDGNTRTVTAQTTFTTDDPAGTMTANIYQPGKVGIWTITAIYNSLVSTATVVVTPVNYVNIDITVSTTTTTTIATFTLTITLHDNDGNPYSGIVAITNTTNSIIPDTVNLVLGTWTGTTTITKSPNGGIDTITAFYAEAMATATIMVFMSSQQGGTVTDKGVTIEFDPGDLGTANVTVHIATATQLSQPLPGEIKYAGIVYNIALKDESGNEVGTRTGQIGTVTVHLAYPDVNNDGVVDGTQIKEENLIIYQWENGTWIALTTGVDGVKNVAYAYVPHFSTFTLGGIPTPAYKNNLIAVVVYPNPCIIDNGHISIIFCNLTDQATIRIFNIAGEKVATFEENDGDGKYIWQNPQLASGIYIYLITNNKGQKAIGKLGIIK